MRIFLFLIIICSHAPLLFSQAGVQSYGSITTGAQQTELYLPKLKNKNVAIVTNASGIIGNRHLVDTLLKHKVKIVKIFGPEHGFRGTADAGEKVKGGKDALTNITIISLYGSHKKPTKEDLKGVDVVIYDIQDVGVRFYTYISTMTYVMEACAENNKELMIFDRPNPNGFYIDGPVMTDKYKSFLGLHNIPIVYAMTCGEYAQMVNGEGWLKNKVKCNLTVIPLKNYDRTKFISGLPVKPSPNLPNDTAVLLYPSLGLFEGTMVSLGRGTDSPFQFVGNPYADQSTFSFTFTPRSTAITKKPKYQDTICYGKDMRVYYDYILKNKQIDLTNLNMFYHNSLNKQQIFFDNNFNYHAGNEELKQQTILSISPMEIRESWKADIYEFKKIRQKYLIYKDL
ncbi:MAG: DUF1343 domain-containing protein [Bacteroidota bacterium]